MAKLDLQHLQNFLSAPKPLEIEVPRIAALPPPIKAKPAPVRAVEKKPADIVIPPRPGRKPPIPVVAAATPQPVPVVPLEEVKNGDPLLILTGAQLLQVAGEPNLRRKDPPAEIWHYESAACMADFYFYGAENDVEAARVSHYEIIEPEEASLLIRPTTDPRTCMKALSSRLPF